VDRPDMRTAEDIATLQRLTEHIPELVSLPAATLTELLREAGLDTCSGESVLYQEGDKPTCFYLLMAGHVSIHTKSASSAFYDAEAKNMLPEVRALMEATVDRLGYPISVHTKGSSFGKVELITEKPRMASVKALDACMLLTVSKQVFKDHLEVRKRFPVLVALSQLSHTMSKHALANSC
jgi:CRP-like cAMP-binding protein